MDITSTTQTAVEVVNFFVQVFTVNLPLLVGSLMTIGIIALMVYTKFAIKLFNKVMSVFTQFVSHE